MLPWGVPGMQHDTRPHKYHTVHLVGHPALPDHKLSYQILHHKLSCQVQILEEVSPEWENYCPYIKWECTYSRGNQPSSHVIQIIWSISWPFDQGPWGQSCEWHSKLVVQEHASGRARICFAGYRIMQARARSSTPTGDESSWACTRQ